MIPRGDKEWWDQAIWILGARHHWLATQDETFLRWSHGVAVRSLSSYDSRRDPRTGLYRGGAVMQDGISGYPTPPADATIESSFVMDHPAAHRIQCLSTNLVHAAAFDAVADMAHALGSDPRPARARAYDMRQAIRRELGLGGAPYFAYFTSDEGVDDHQESLGIALAVELGLVGPEEGAAVLAAAHREPFGVPAVWPHFPEFDANHPGRHNGLIWPMIQGFWATAWAKTGQAEGFERALSDLVSVLSSPGGMWECYNAKTGLPDGGWQRGRRWESEPDQTWSATALMRAVHQGLFGISVTLDGLYVRPLVPRDLGGAALSLTGLRYGGSTLDIIATRVPLAQAELGLRVNGATHPYDSPIRATGTRLAVEVEFR